MRHSCPFCYGVVQDRTCVNCGVTFPKDSKWKHTVENAVKNNSREDADANGGWSNAVKAVER